MADRKKKKTTPKATSKNRKPTAKKTTAKKTVVSKKSNKTTMQKRTNTRQNNLKHRDSDEQIIPKRGKKEEKIVINLTPKSAQKAKVTPSKSVTKQVTEQLPDSAKLKTIHLHFRID